MQTRKLGNRQNRKELVGAIRPLRALNNSTNLAHLFADYLTLAVILCTTIAFYQFRPSWELSWAWNIPVTLVAIALVGGVQHRLAGLGHEAAHYTLFKNKLANELVADWFCMFPIFATTQQYRLVHLAHHQFTNDWQRDPDVVHIGKSKLMDQFPMTRAKFIYRFYIRFFLPHVLLRYLWNVVALSVFGSGESPYEQRSRHDEASQPPSLRITSLVGVGYVFCLAGLLVWISHHGGVAAILLVPAVALPAALVTIALIPARAFFVSPLKGIYSAKTAAALRLTYYTLLVSAFGWLRHWTGTNWGAYFFLLWLVPLLTSFAYYMLLRDVYQHANADDGKLTNTRVFFPDPFTRWAVFVYGMDMHVPHHLYPAIPHYHLPALHRLLVDHDPLYAGLVVECHGTFTNATGKPTILDVMQTPAAQLAPEPPRERLFEQSEPISLLGAAAR